MEMLKKNVFWIVCGLVAALGIALSVWGLDAMAAVKTEMSQAEDIQRRLQSAVRKPVNKAAIDAEQGRVETIRKSFEEITALAHKHNGPPPLGIKKEAWEAYLTVVSQKPATTEGEPKPPSIPDCVFPDAKGQKAIDFREAYKDELLRLRGLLKADGPPTTAEINNMATTIKEEQPNRKDLVPTPTPDSSGASPTPGKSEPKPPTSGLVNDEECHVNASCRAAVGKAHGIFCYIADDSLEEIARVKTGDLKDLQADLLWDAQRTLWVQQDVVQALAAINNSAAEELRKAGKEPWVGLMPVKDLISIRSSDYIREKTDGAAPAKPGGETPAKPPGSPAESFTKQISSPMYDVVQFTVKLVVDARQIPAVISEICQSRFHTPIRVAYAAEPPNLKMTGKIYGADPVVNLVVDFESYYFTDVYRPLMPKAALAKLAAAGGKSGDAP